MSLPIDADYELLQRRVNRAKVDILFEEPCPLYEEDDDYTPEERHGS